MPGKIRSSQESELVDVPNTRGTRMAVLIGPDDGAPNFATRRFVLEPGAYIPAHRHPDIEHEQYVTQGEMTLVLDGASQTASAGDTVFIPARCVHSYRNDTEAPCEFLCIVPLRETYETEWLEELE